jgi:hypothetical protein
LAGFITLGKINVPENGWCLSTTPDRRPPLFGAVSES